jgi:DNA end-binding protein Ku
MAKSARSIASLTISFGLVAIPVKLYSAALPSERISFHLLRQKDGSRVKEQYISVADGKLVDRSEMAKGYEFAKGKYVMFSPNEIKALEEARSSSIDIAEVVPLDPVYFAGTYYLAPDKGGAKPYTLLAMSLRKSRQCAVGRWVSRGKEHMVIIRPMEDGLALHQLHFQAEVRSFEDLGVKAAKVSDAELKLADQLMEHLKAKKFDPSEYVDEFKGRVQAAIKDKVKGHEVSLSAEPEKASGGNVIDLMAALRASLDKNKTGGASGRASFKPRKATGRGAGTARGRRAAR